MMDMVLQSKRKIPKTAHKHLLVCIPAFNEGESLGAVLDKLKILPLREEFDILVIDDGSSDNTRAVCEERGIDVITHIYNMGYGMALKTAYKYADDNQYDYIIQMDADGQHDVKNVEHIYKSLTDINGTVRDIVVGSRFMPDSIGFHISPVKKFAINFFGFLIKLATGTNVTDPTSGLQGLNRKAFVCYAKFNNFALDYPDANMLIQMLLNNFVVEEIPAVMHSRQNGESMHGSLYKQIKYVTNMIISVIIVCIREFLNSKKLTKSPFHKTT